MPASRSLQSGDSPVETPCVTTKDEHSSYESGLLARVAGGDELAMEDCIRTYGPLVRTIVQRRVRNLTEADDLIQEIFTEVWRSAGRHDPSLAAEAGFIAVIARRRSIDLLRREQRLPEIESLTSSAEFEAPSEIPGRELDREALWLALDRLPEETRRLFVLHFEQGMTHGEIAELTGLPLGSVKTRLRRGLIEARSMFKHLGDMAPNSNPRMA